MKRREHPSNGKPLIPRVWTFSRQLWGNVLPALCGFPFIAYGLWWMKENESLLGLGLIWLILGIVVMAVSLNWLGLFGNKALRDQFDSLYAGKLVGTCHERMFVGFARPGFSSLIDPHQEIGYLVIGAAELEFIGESIHLRIPRSQVAEIKFRPNPHSLLGLGRWVCAEGSQNGKPFRLMIEPRERSSLLANKRLGLELKMRLTDWIHGKSAPTA